MEISEIIKDVSKDKIYYQTDLGVLINGDCLEILPLIPDNSVDLVLTDPPYEIHAKSGGGLHNKRTWLKDIHEAGIDTFSPAKFFEMMPTKHAYIFTSKNILAEYIQMASGLNWDLLVYAKKNPIPTKNNKYLSDREYVLFTRKGGEYFNNDLPYEKYYGVQYVNVTKNEFHPAEKDIDYICDKIKMSTKDGQTVMDMFFGSGTTGLACEKLGRKWIGVEINEGYCAIAKKRIEQEARQIKMF